MRMAYKIPVINLQLLRSNISIKQIYITLNRLLPLDQAFN